MTNKMKFHWSNFWRYRFLLNEIVRKNVRLQYRNSTLGMLWSLVQPLLFSLVLAFVFSTLLGGGDPDGIPRILYILSGRLMFSFFSDGTQGAMRSVRANSSIIKKVYVPKYIYPMGTVLSKFVNFAISLIVLVVFVAINDIQKGTTYGLHFRLLYAVVPITILLVFSMGVGLMLSSISVFFRDTEFIYSVLCNLLFYISPIIYSTSDIEKKSAVGDALKIILRANPLYGIMQMFRTAIFYSPGETGNIFNALPFYYSQWQLLYTAGIAVLALVFGAYVFYKQQDKFILHI